MPKPGTGPDRAAADGRPDSESGNYPTGCANLNATGSHGRRLPSVPRWTNMSELELEHHHTKHHDGPCQAESRCWSQSDSDAQPSHACRALFGPAGPKPTVTRQRARRHALPGASRPRRVLVTARGAAAQAPRRNLPARPGGPRCSLVGQDRSRLSLSCLRLRPRLLRGLSR